MAYVALGCTWAAIEETAPIAQTDTGSCLRVEWPLIEPGECLTGIERVGEVKFSGTTWHDTNIALPATAEWWLVSPAGAGYTVVSTAALHDLNEQSDGENPPPDDLDTRVTESIYIPGPGITTASDVGGVTIDITRNWYVLLGQNSDDELLVYSEQDIDVTVQRLVTAPTPE